MPADTKNMTVLQLTEAVLPYIKAKNYSESYVKSFGNVFNCLNHYCTEHGITHFTTKSASSSCRNAMACGLARLTGGFHGRSGPWICWLTSSSPVPL